MFELGEVVSVDSERGRIVGIRLVDRSTALYQTVEYEVYISSRDSIRTFTNELEMVSAFREDE